MPYKEGQPRKRSGNHPVVNDMRSRIRRDRKASGWCGIVMLAIMGGVLVAIGAVGYVVVHLL